MKRDMDLCRRVLLELEGIDFGPGLIELTYDDVEQNVVFYHLKLLDEAGLIEACVGFRNSVSPRPLTVFPDVSGTKAICSGLAV
jgi:hypothetical protein